MKHLKDYFLDTQIDKTPYLNAVELVSAITQPDLLPSNHIGKNPITMNSNGTPLAGFTTNNGRSTYGMYNISGAAATSGLASALQSTIFPSQTDWFKLTLTEDMKSRLISNGAKETDIDLALSKLSKRVKYKLSQLNYQSKTGRIFLRTIVEDNTLVIVEEDNIRSIPFRNVGIKSFGGNISYVVWQEEVEDPDKPGEATNQYTYVKYPKGNNPGEVYQQLENATQAVKITKGLNPNRVFVVYGNHPDVSAYAESYASKHYALINEINQISYDLSRARAIALKSLMFLNPLDETITPEMITNAQPGMCIKGTPDSIGWLSSVSKISEWQWCSNSLQELIQQLEKSFALDLTSYPQFSQPRTATEINAITTSLDAKVASLAQTVQETFAAPLVYAIMDLVNEEEKDNGATGGLLENIKPIVTSGTSAFNSLIEFQKLIQGLATVAQLDPNLAQRIDSVEILKTFSAATGINTDDYIKEPQQQILNDPNSQAQYTTQQTPQTQ